MTAARTIARAFLAAVVAALGVAALAGPAAAAPAAPATGVRLDIVKVSGLIDPINADLISRSVRSAGNDHALALVLELNSSGGTISPQARDALAAQLLHAAVPVAIWVGGTGSPRALGTSFTLLRAAGFTGESPGSKVGNGPPPPETLPDGLEHRTMSGDDAVDAHLLDSASPTLVDFLADLSGHTIKGVHI
ncbi:MAG TPA: hypothetical protein VMU14_04385, partial [Acidimicrobiales bacterium]|nr:hypothetical protein [Acidimicrobiales bacterium]